jgi:hypothetical protein
LEFGYKKIVDRESFRAYGSFEILKENSMLKILVVMERTRVMDR